MNCSVINDLLPLYIDECCSEESKRLVCDHLKTCASCQRACKQMQKEFGASAVKIPDRKPHCVNLWRASLLQTFVLFLTFAIMTLGVTLEAATPKGETNGLWAVALIVPATAMLLSLPSWFFVRFCRSRKGFSLIAFAITGAMSVLGYAWALLHYGSIATNAPRLWIGIVLSIIFCLLSKLLSSRYARLLGKE